jgi:membrane-associated phospholipid phosphatase
MTPPAHLRVIRPLAVAVVAAILYAALGAAVSHVPPRGIDLAGRAFAGQAQHLALLFTRSCLWYSLVALGLIVVAVAIRFPAWRARALYAIPTTLIAWQVSDALKIVFRRPRPEYWRLIHEPTFSYSSGHAMFAVLVYWLWAWFIWNSSLPRPARLVVAPLFALWGCGVIWSRLALGAHYVTDLIGGVLLAVTALGLASAISWQFSAPARAGRPRTRRDT